MTLPRPILRAALAAVVAAAAAGCATDDRENLGAQVYLHNAQGYAEGGHWDQALDQFPVDGLLEREPHRLLVTAV